MLTNIVLLCFALLSNFGTTQSVNKWNGKWFPSIPDGEDRNPIIPFKRTDLTDHKHGIKMGIKDATCDDAKKGLIQDWFKQPENYTCLDNRKLYLPNSYIHPLHTIERIPPHYNAPHACMNETIEYNEIIPTFGTHRPLWGVFGEYKFLPKQRWLHNLEHGAIVMLYHPCADRNEVNLLKKIVKNCLYKHIITPYNLLEPNRPLVLISWGHRLEMSRVAIDLAVKFIKDHAIHGPEKLTKNGQYDFMLLHKAKIVSDINDSNLCPNDNESGITMK